MILSDNLQHEPHQPYDRLHSVML